MSAVPGDDEDVVVMFKVTSFASITIYINLPKFYLTQKSHYTVYCRIKH